MTLDDLQRTTDMIHGGLLGVAVGNMLDAAARGSAEPEKGRADAALTRAVLEGYLTAGESVHFAAAEMWIRFSYNRYDADPSTTAAIGRLGRHLGSGADPALNGFSTRDSRGDGSLRRCLPTALTTFYLDIDRRRAESERISSITHAHPLCADSCVAYNEIAAALLNRVSSRESVVRAGRMPSLHLDVAEALNVRPDASLDSLSASGHALDTLRSAAWAVQQSESFEDVLVALTSVEGTTAGSAAGGLLGIVHGASGIPRQWRDQIPHGSRLAEAARKLAERHACHRSIWDQDPVFFAILDGDGRDIASRVGL